MRQLYETIVCINYQHSVHSSLQPSHQYSQCCTVAETPTTIFGWDQRSIIRTAANQSQTDKPVNSAQPHTGDLKLQIEYSLANSHQ